MKIHVLIIDDDPQVLTSFMEILKNIKETHQVKVCPRRKAGNADAAAYDT